MTFQYLNREFRNDLINFIKFKVFSHHDNFQFTFISVANFIYFGSFI